ncbi:UDP-N-acetylmuramoyl-L-alanyl-D-glutamate--2,6-diaminopimelate ligase [bacterium]|nr:UDP-N-acetylmuramoyl-L-alanyl-D-glutamate--2,6-diaminopimelate ligase [bacterium]
MIKGFLKKIIPRFFLEKFWHYPKGVLAFLIYGKPAKNLKIIGVAGTKGKTTTCHLIAHILEKSKKKVAMISTASLKIGENEELNHIKMTTPSPFFLQKFIKEAVKKGCQYLVLEVSSHALSQYRISGISFSAVVFTNLTPDHLEYHQNKKEYQEVHFKMISRSLKCLILNKDDLSLEKILFSQIKNLKEIITFGIKKDADVLAEDIFLTEKGTLFKIKTEKESISVNLHLLGKFNVYNALAATAVSLSQKIDLLKIKEALEDFKGVPGRIEIIESKENFKVIVDYAHSPESLKNLFEAIKPIKKGKVITIFGACGERDKTKRPLMGEIIDKNSDCFIATNDDPYSENPEKIAEELISGVKTKKLNENFFKILDRREAIKKGISLAKKDDLVLVLGKGAEQWQVFKGKKIPWDDRKIVKEILNHIV